MGGSVVTDQPEQHFAADPAQSGIEIMRASETARLGLLDEIGAARQSTVIAYLTSTRSMRNSSIRDDDVRVLERHLAAARAAGAENIDLFLSTWGGEAVMPWNFHAMFRDYFPKARLGVILPFEAYSAGTSISLGADEIIMGLSSVLGPTDTQMYRQDFGAYTSVNDFGGFLDLVRQFDSKRKIEDKATLDWLSRNIDPLVLGRVYRVWRENRRKIMNALESRRRPLPARDNERIADFFLYEIGIHSQAIRRREAIAAGLSFISLLEDTPVAANVPVLFEHYADLMKLFSPYALATTQRDKVYLRGDEHDIDVYGVPASQTPVAMIESRFATDAAFLAFGEDRHWGSPPQVPAPAEPDTAGQLTTSWIGIPHQGSAAGRPSPMMRKRR